MAKEKTEKALEKKHGAGKEKDSDENKDEAKHDEKKEKGHSNEKAEKENYGERKAAEEKHARANQEAKEPRAEGSEPSEKAEKKHSGKRHAKQSGVWVEYKPKEIEELIVNLANQGHTASEIGAILRDQHGIPNVKQLTKKTILAILTEAGIKQQVPEDLLSLVKKAVTLHEHLKKNRKDTSAKRGYELTVSKIRRLTKYYIRAKRLPGNWRYSIETATLLVK